MRNLQAMANEIDELGDVFLQTEAVLPVQFYGARRRATLEPVQRLMLAMLTDAVRSFQSNAGACLPAKRREFAEAQSWICSDDDNGFFSFSAVCDAVGIDAKALREGLLCREQRNHATSSKEGRPPAPKASASRRS